MTQPRIAALLLALTTLASGCSIRSLAVGGLSNALAGSADAFAREDDPELVREAMPFALKAIEGVLIEDPENETLLSAASAGFGLYAYAFVQLPAEALERTDYDGSVKGKQRALAFYLRARDYGLRALEIRHPEITSRLRLDPTRAANELLLEDLEAAYWAGGTWGLAIALGKDDPALVADLEAVRALLRRVLALDESWGGGSVHEAMIPVEGLPRAMGGSVERARQHFERAKALSGGNEQVFI